MREQIANTLTLLNLLFGIISIYFSINNNFLYASISILLAVMMDFLDGRIARILKSESTIGKELDSLCDLVSFGVAPAIMIYMLFREPITAILAGLLVLGGAYRLARFNITKTVGFEGIPITTNGIIFPILYFLSATKIIFLVLLLLSTILMVSKIKIKKL